ncbi:hypothetical protein [Desulfogranum marinum]|uniref:hypothetical protein n=1 Tax=Desulfogranum marinum TaxID=453220 RepID=UPI0029C697E2|nr:hypothetical protein [Desulfogranum marinum]
MTTKEQELRQAAVAKGLVPFRFKMPQGANSSCYLFFIKTDSGKLLNNGESLDLEEAIEFVERNPGPRKKPTKA